MTTSRRHLSIAIPALLLAALSFNACKGGGSSARGAALGEGGGDDALWKGDAPALRDEAVMTAAFTVARSTLYGEPRGDSSALDALPGRRAFLCVYGVSQPASCGTGVGDTLTGSITAAASQLSQESGGKIKAARERGDDVRLKLDIVTHTSDRSFERGIEKPKKRSVGVYGFWVKNGEKTSYVLPSEVLEQGVFSDRKNAKGIPRKNLEKALKARVSGFGGLPDEFPYTRLFTVSWVEGDPHGVARPSILRVYRVHRAQFDVLSEELLRQRAVWAADYLISSVSAEGKIRYIYYPTTDRDSSSYNLLRHGGTTYSILQAYDRTQYEPYRLAAVKAIDYLFARTREDVREGPFGGGPTKWILSPGDKVKLGGAGLALVMLDQYGEATGDFDRYREDAIKFGNFLVAELKADGEFVYFPALTPGGKPTDTDDSAYYPGEAILGLIRLHSWDRNEKWLTAAKAASDWLIDVRDKGKSERNLANDHWLMIALSYLYAETKDERYLQHSLNLARAVEYQYELNRKSWEDYPDYQGGYYDPPRSTPAATRGEGLVAVLDTCRVASKDCTWVYDLLMETVRHENLSQYDPDMMWWIKNRKKAFGGWNGGLIDTEIRNDFVQHNMSSILGAERHMAYRARQEELPGGPVWTGLNLKDGRRNPGLSPAEGEVLHEATWRYRGKNHWERSAEAADGSDPQPDPEEAPGEGEDEAEDDE